MSILPKVTVLIATYNYEAYIGMAIESILEQDYPTNLIEIIIVDDGSEDNTEKVVERYKSRISCEYVYQQNQGKAVATKLGMHMASGKYIFILDADDFYLEKCISTVVARFEQDESIVQISHLANRYDEASKTTVPQTCNHSNCDKLIPGSQMIFDNLFKGYNVGLGSTFACRGDILKSIDIPAEVDMYIDYFLFLKVAARGKIIQLSENLSVFRRHERAYSEGEKKFEDQKVRAMRYLKSAKATYLSISNDALDTRIKQAIKLFYLQHLAKASVFIDDYKPYKVNFEIFKLTFNLVSFNDNKIRFLKNNLKYLIRK